MVPLALACHSKPFAWCKIAGEKFEWSVRLAKTLELLVPKTKTNWRRRGKLALHIALDNGPEVTKALVRAMGSIGHGMYEDYTYTDKTGEQYSPCQYVQTFSEARDFEKAVLVTWLTGRGIK